MLAWPAISSTVGSILPLSDSGVWDATVSGKVPPLARVAYGLRALFFPYRLCSRACGRRSTPSVQTPPSTSAMRQIPRSSRCCRQAPSCTSS